MFYNTINVIDKNVELWYGYIIYDKMTLVYIHLLYSEKRKDYELEKVFA